MLRSIAANEKANIVAFGGCASPAGEMDVKPFISIHRIDNNVTFPILCSQSFLDLDTAITSLEWIYLAKKPTLLACDANSLLVLEFASNELNVLQTVKLHSSKGDFNF